MFNLFLYNVTFAYPLKTIKEKSKCKGGERKVKNKWG